MSEPICHILVLLLRLDEHVILVALGMGIFDYWPVHSFLLPLQDVFEGDFKVPVSGGDVPILIQEKFLICFFCGLLSREPKFR